MALKPSRFLDPKSDVVFKKIFGNNEELAKSILNGLLPLPDDALITELTYLTPEQSPRIPALKNTVVDVKCTDQKGRTFIVEMQMNWTSSFTKRLIFGVSQAFVQQLNKGEDYKSLCPVYGLGIINDVFDRKTAEWFHHYKTINVKDQTKVLDGLELIFLELPKFVPKTFQHRKMGVLWLRFLRELDENLVDIPQEFLENPEINKAMELAQESAFTIGELNAYDRYWDAVRVENTFKADAADALKKGIEEAKKGIETRVEEAKEEAKEEEKVEIAHNLLKLNLDVHTISLATGLDIHKIESLKKDSEPPLNHKRS